MARMQLGKFVLCSLLLASHCLTSAHASDMPAGRVKCEAPRSVHDGDTFRCLSEGQNFPVRIAGVDAPETGQAFWRVARDSLRSQLSRGALLNCYKVDVRYGRQVCRVAGLNGHDIALELVRTGMAWHTVKYRHEQTVAEQNQFAEAEAEARARQLGLWSQPEPQEPSECRALKKQRNSCR